MHPIKILGNLELEDSLAAVVVHVDQAGAVLAAAPPWARVIVLHTASPTPGEWATEALDAVQSAL